MSDSNGHRFKTGDRVFSHYVMDWGTVQDDGVSRSGESDAWYDVRMDKTHRIESLNDGGLDIDAARIVSPEIAERFGYGTDPTERRQ
jgi:hypothetical protein